MTNELQISETLLNSASEKIALIELKEKEEGLHFNVFRILDRFDDEEKGHSAFLADLINPKGKHGQNNLFLKLFIECLKNEITTDKFDSYSEDCYRSFTVETEKNIGNGRIDILIKNRKLAIAIENKIYAEDQHEQLQRYKKYLDALRANNIDNILIYLTLNGDSPSEYSRGKLSKDAYHCVSYNFIVGWLDLCIETCDIAHIKTIILHYKQCVETLTGKIGTTMSNELTDLLLKKHNLDTAIKMANVIHKAKAIVLDNFLKELRNRMHSHIEILNTEHTHYAFKFTPNSYHKNFGNINVAREYYRNRKKLNFFGYAIEIYRRNEHIANFEIRIASKLYFGAWANDSSNNLKDDIISEFLSDKTPHISKIENLESGKTITGRIVFFPKEDLNFRVFNHKCTQLSDPVELNNYLDDLLNNEIFPNLKNFIDACENCAKHSEQLISDYLGHDITV